MSSALANFPAVIFHICQICAFPRSPDEHTSQFPRSPDMRLRSFMSARVLDTTQSFLFARSPSFTLIAVLKKIIHFQISRAGMVHRFEIEIMRKGLKGGGERILRPHPRSSLPLCPGPSPCMCILHCICSIFVCCRESVVHLYFVVNTIVLYL